MRRSSNPRATLVFVLIAAFLMIIADLAIWHFQRSDLPLPAEQNVAVVQHNAEFMDTHFPPDHTIEAAEEESLAYLYPQPLHGPVKPEAPQPDVPKIKTPPIQKPAGQYWRDNAVSAPASGKKARIVIIIDDMGMGRKHSYDVIDLPAPLTLAFLPYAPALDKITKDARAKGHELLIHAPMEPLDHLNPGPIALLNDMTEQELKDSLGKMFNSFSGYVGINNHMGSRLTQNAAAMHVVMNELAARGLIFVDSKTINSSVAGKIAAEHGLDYAERDVFLDHKETLDFARNALLEAERHARKYGSAIAIGHPKVNTIQALKEWLPLAEERGFVVVPVSAVVRRQGAKTVEVQSSYGPMPAKLDLRNAPVLQPFPLQSQQP